MVYEAAVEKPLIAVWSSWEALEQAVPAEAVAVAMMVWLFVGVPLTIAHLL